MSETLTLQQQSVRAANVHLTALLNLISGVGGLLIALLVFFYYRKRAAYVAFHALQAFFMQAALWLGGCAVALLCWLGASWLQERNSFGFFALPFAFLISLIPLSNFLLAILASMDIRRGNDYHYPIVAEWALRILRDA